MALGSFALMRYTRREVTVTEIKLNKATNLLNKTKIKFEPWAEVHTVTELADIDKI